MSSRTEASFALAQARTDTAADWDVIPDRLLGSLRQVVPGMSLVIKGPLGSVDELGLGLAHAQRLVRQVKGPAVAAPMSIESLVLATAGSGAHAAAENLLAPLRNYDQANNEPADCRHCGPTSTTTPSRPGSARRCTSTGIR